MFQSHNDALYYISQTLLAFINATCGAFLVRMGHVQISSICKLLMKLERLPLEVVSNGNTLDH